MLQKEHSHDGKSVPHKKVHSYLLDTFQTLYMTMPAAVTLQ